MNHFTSLARTSRPDISDFDIFHFSSSVQTVYLADEEANLVAVKFWGGLKVFNSIVLRLISIGNHTVFRSIWN